MKEWCIPTADAEFVAKMEDVLEVYQRPYDPVRPVVCIDETNKQLIGETRIPCEPGHPEVADVFMIAEPLAGKMETVVTQTRTALDFAEILRYTSDALYLQAEKIVLVTDNLNTHFPASLYKAFPPEEARRIAEHFEWHYTPKHGSWLDMAEIEIGIMTRQALKGLCLTCKASNNKFVLGRSNVIQSVLKSTGSSKRRMPGSSWPDSILIIV